MSKISIDPVLIEQTRQKYRLARTRKQRKEVVLEGMHKCCFTSYGGFIRHLRLGELCLSNRPTRKLSEKENARIAEMNVLAQLVWDQAQKYSYGENKVRISASYRVLRRTGRIPSGVSDKHIYAAIDRLELKNQSATVAKRFEREHPLSMIQMDFSRSRFIEYIGNSTTGEWKLRIRNPEYTRKEVLRLWFGMAVDDATRVAFVKYYVTKGEDTDVTQDLIEDTFSEKEAFNRMTGECSGERRKLLQGIPKSIYVDRGPGFKTSTKLGLEKMGVEMIVGTDEKDSMGRSTNNSNKKARGKVEKKNGDFKTMFETELSMELGEGYELTLDELNERASLWLEEFNCKHHPTRKREIKWEIFSPALGEAKFPDENMRLLFARTITRRVINRLLKVAENIWCKAPDWANDGEDVEIIIASRNYYTMYKGKRLHLEIFSSLDTDIRPTKREEITSDMLEGRSMKIRLDEEIKNASHAEITLASLPDDFEDDIRQFCEAPRSIKEIREKAVAFVMQCEARDKQPEAKPTIAFINGERV